MRPGSPTERVNEVTLQVTSNDAIVGPGVLVSEVRLPEVPLSSFSDSVINDQHFRIGSTSWLISERSCRPSKKCIN